MTVHTVLEIRTYPTATVPLKSYKHKVSRSMARPTGTISQEPECIIMDGADPRRSIGISWLLGCIYIYFYPHKE